MLSVLLRPQFLIAPLVSSDSSDSVVFFVFYFITAASSQESKIISIGLLKNIAGQWKDHAFIPVDQRSCHCPVFLPHHPMDIISDSLVENTKVSRENHQVQKYVTDKLLSYKAASSTPLSRVGIKHTNCSSDSE